MSFISGCLNVFVLFYCTWILGVPGGDPNPRHENMEQSENKRRSMTTIPESMTCHFCNRIFFDKVGFIFHLETHFVNERNAHQNLGQSENWRKSAATHSMPMACRVCDKVFFDKVSLVFHFESHLQKETPNPRQYVSTPESIKCKSPMTLNSSEAASSSKERGSVTRQSKIPRMMDYSRPCSLTACSSKAPNISLKDVGSVQAPVLNSNLPSISSFFARSGSWLSNLHSTQSPKTVISSLRESPKTDISSLKESPKTVISSLKESPKTVISSLSHRFFNSQLGAYRVGSELAAEPSKKQDGGEESSIKQVEKPCKEIIVISDDEEDDNKTDVEKLDLTLRL